MKKIRSGTRNVRCYKRLIAAAVLAIAGIAAVCPVLDRQSAEQKAPDGKASRSVVDVELLNNYQSLTLDLQKQASRLRGKAGIVIKDLKTGQTIEINSSKLFPSASLVKIPIMAACFKAEKEGRLSIYDKITLRKQHKEHSCSRLYRARLGTKYTILELMERMITESDNTATNMLTDRLGFGYLNEKFTEFGLKNTDMRRGIMDLKWRNAGIENYTTAGDMALILEKIYKGELIDEYASANMLEILKRQKVRDRIPRWLPSDLVVAHKTGLLRDTVSDVGVVFTPDGDFIVCVITADVNSFKIAKQFIGRVAIMTYNRCYRKDVAQSAGRPKV